mmetsp:Transcript_23365/g.65395  ORF Transcript_23365/g.65395 Transcript_23365/m.65395 type:complete len:200 (+) Transcript_23365:405-1004(+)
MVPLARLPVLALALPHEVAAGWHARSQRQLPAIQALHAQGLALHGLRLELRLRFVRLLGLRLELHLHLRDGLGLGLRLRQGVRLRLGDGLGLRHGLRLQEQRLLGLRHGLGLHLRLGPVVGLQRLGDLLLGVERELGGRVGRLLLGLGLRRLPRLVRDGLRQRMPPRARLLRVLLPAGVGPRQRRHGLVARGLEEALVR